MKLLFLLALLVSVVATASPPIPSTRLTNELAAELGFKLDIISEKFGKTVELKGPQTLLDNCVPLAVGNFVFRDKKEISGFISKPSNQSPQAIGYLGQDIEATLIVFIDYQCKNNAMRY